MKISWIFLVDCYWFLDRYLCHRKLLFDTKRSRWCRSRADARNYPAQYSRLRIHLYLTVAYSNRLVNCYVCVEEKGCGCIMRFG